MLKARFFVPGKLSQPSLMFVGKARSLPQSGAPEIFYNIGPGVNVLKHFFVGTKQAKVSGKVLLVCLIFASHVRPPAYPQSEFRKVFHLYKLWPYSQTLALPGKSSKYKRSNLFDPIVSDEEKIFIASTADQGRIL